MLPELSRSPPQSAREPLFHNLDIIIAKLD
jgi:hypothetical protein